VKASANILRSLPVILVAAAGCVVEMHPADSAPPPQAGTNTGGAGASSQNASQNTVVRTGPSGLAAPVRRQNFGTGGASALDTTPSTGGTSLGGT
jgi:hypothetical protein